MLISLISLDLFHSLLPFFVFLLCPYSIDAMISSDIAQLKKSMEAENAQVREHGARRKYQSRKNNVEVILYSDICFTNIKICITLSS